MPSGQFLDPTYWGKSDFTKATWAKGDIPVIPAGYPFEQEDVKLTVKGVYPGQHAARDSHHSAERREGKDFRSQPQGHGSGANRAWLVDYWITNHDNGMP